VAKRRTGPLFRRARLRVPAIVTIAVLFAAGASMRVNSAPRQEPARTRIVPSDDKWFDGLTRRLRDLGAEGASVGRYRAMKPYHVIFRGNDGWLFHGLHDAWSCAAGTPALAPVIRTIDLSARVIRASGRPTVVALVPPKREIVGDALPPSLRRFLSCDVPFTDTLRGGLARVEGSIDLRRPLAAARSAAVPVWYRDDAHWTPRGAWELTSRAIAAFSPGLADDSDLRVTGRERRTGDIARVLGDREGELVPTWRIDRAGVTSSKTSVPQPPGPDGKTFMSWRHRTTAPAGTPMLRGRTTLFHDSFGKMVATQLASYADDLTAVHWGTTVRAITDAVQRSERVVMEFISPFAVGSFTGDAARTPEALAVALRSDLPTRGVLLDVGPIDGREGDKLLLTQAPVGAIEIRTPGSTWRALELTPTDTSGWRATRLPRARTQIRSLIPLSAQLVELQNAS
jgi:hypothetical protein